MQARHFFLKKTNARHHRFKQMGNRVKTVNGKRFSQRRNLKKSKQLFKTTFPNAPKITVADNMTRVLFNIFN